MELSIWHMTDRDWWGSFWRCLGA